MKDNNELVQYNWVKNGLIWGATMYITLMLIIPALSHETFTSFKLIIGIPVWISGGLLYGYIMKTILIRKARKQQSQH